MHMFRILIIKTESKYGALNVFEEELIHYWKHMGIIVDYTQVIEPHVKYDFTFTMNGGICLSDETILSNYFKMPIYSYYVDHPLWHDLSIKGSALQHCIVVDNDFKGYMDRHYQLSHEADVVMQAGVEGFNSRRTFMERKYPVVFCGSYRDYAAIGDRINGERKSFSIFMKYMIEKALECPSLTMEQMYNITLEHFKFPLEGEEYTEFLFACRDVEGYLRGYYRAMVVKEIVDAGIPVEVYGEGWEQLNCERKDLLHCHPSVDYREMLDVFADAQIVINVMPWAKAGFHDRTACGMLNGALVFSDETSYMREERLDGNKLILYTLDAIQEVPGKIAYYLKHLDEAERIAQSGYQWAKKNHTWQNRAQQFVEIFERYQSNVDEKAVTAVQDENSGLLSEEFENLLKLWQQYLSAMKKMHLIGLRNINENVFTDFLDQINELAGCTAEIKTNYCNGGGMIWLEKDILRIVKSVKERYDRKQYGEADQYFLKIITDTGKQVEQLQEIISLGPYYVNYGKIEVKAGVKTANLSTIKEAITALDENSMNPLEQFFFLQPHKKMTKWSHYFEVYHRHFEPFRNRPITVLEVGVFGGGSLQMWKKYFGPQCNIIGIDIMEECKAYEEEQIKIYIGSQEDRNFLRRLKSEIGRVDIIIDDGGHAMNQQIVTFEELFPILSDGGVYLCEDMHTSYWPDFGGGYKQPDTFMEYSKNFVDGLNARYSLSDALKADEFTRHIRGIHYYDSMIVLEKGEHKLSMPFWI